MSSGSLAKRYARAVFELADEAKQVERVGKDLQDVSSMWSSSSELQELFKNPGFAADVRKQVLTDLATRAALSPTVRNTLLYLSDRGRLSALPLIAQTYARLAEEKAGGVRAEVISASPLTEAYYQSLQRTLEQATGKKVTIEKKTDPSLIAGVVTRVGDQVFDGSVRNRLNELRDSLRSA